MRKVQWDDADEADAPLKANDAAMVMLDQVRSSGELPTFHALLGVDPHAYKTPAYVVELCVGVKKAKDSYMYGFLQLQRQATIGDVESIYMCDKCGAVLPHVLSQGVTYMCPSKTCGFVDSTERIRDKVFFRVTPTRLAKLVVEHWLKLGGDADISMRRFALSAHAVVQAGKEGKNFSAAEAMKEAAREKVERLVYTRDRLMRDNANSLDLVKQVKGFLIA